MTLDEQMEAIERTYYDGLNLPWVSEDDHGTFQVRDAHHFAIVDDGSAEDNTYLVACANAATPLVAEVRRLRHELAHAGPPQDEYERVCRERDDLRAALKYQEDLYESNHSVATWTLTA